MGHGDEQLAAVPAELPSAESIAASAQAARQVAARPMPVFPTLMHRDEQHVAAQAWLPPQASARVEPAQPIAAAPNAAPNLPASQNLSSIPLTMAQGKAGGSLQAPTAGLPPGLPPAVMAAALARNPAFGQPRAGTGSASVSPTPVSQGTMAAYSAGVPSAGIKGMPQPPPPAPLGWNAVATPAIQAQQLPVAAAPEQVPGAMQQALDKYEQMIKTRKPQGQQVSALN